MYLGLEKENL